MFWNFQGISRMLLLLDLFLNILFFLKPLINEIVFLILFLVCLLLVYRNTIDFHILILFPSVIRTHFWLFVYVCVCVCMPVSNPQGFLYTGSFHLHTEIGLLLLFQFRYHFFFLSNCPDYKLQQNVFFLILGRSIQCFTIKDNVS